MALWLSLRRKIDARTGEVPIRYGRDMLLMLWVVLVVDSVLVAVLHLTIPRAWPRRILLGIARVHLAPGLRRHAVRVSAHGRVLLRFTAMRDHTVPLGAVSSVDVERRTWDISTTDAVVEDTLVLPVQNSTNVSLTLHQDVEVTVPRHPDPVAVRKLRFAADDPVAAQKLIAGALERR
jgi:hypothetical protein